MSAGATGRPLRIVQVTPSYSPCVGGAERLLQAVSERLAARGHDVTVLTFDCATQRDFGSIAGAGLAPEEALNGVRVVRVPPAGGRLVRWHRWWLGQRGGWRSTRWVFGPDVEYVVGQPSGLAALPALLRIPADVLVAVNWHYGVAWWTWRAARWRGLPLVGAPILHIDRPWAGREPIPRMLRSTAATIVCSGAEGEFVAARGARRVVVAGGGVDPARWAPGDGAGARLRARHGLGDRPVVGFVGRQDTLKGVPTLCDAMERVWRVRPEAVLLLAGSSAHRSAEVGERLAALAAERDGRVVLVDDFAEEDGPGIMAACDLLAQPSVEEAFGLVLVEAWLSGRPVIGADIAATRSLIEPGRDGYLVRPFDGGDLAGRILELLGDPARRRAFGARGRAKVLATHTWDRVAERWEAALEGAARPGAG